MERLDLKEGHRFGDDVPRNRDGGYLYEGGSIRQAAMMLEGAVLRSRMKPLLGHGGYTGNGHR
jgi:hypothetical protein